ncbi:MAG TPA: carboxylating nicotinate-nucleotide diphosphorylase [Candidatus Acidoferrales bacterium]|nr:carboxylating nicotinate-nucleotide diphosphorylase [Candidatus Acidoferrales bacterium]
MARHPALEHDRFAPLTAQGALAFADLVGAALSEDAAGADITSLATIDVATTAQAQLVVRSEAVVAGLQIAALAFRTVDPATDFSAVCEDGELVRGKTIARVRGLARSLLSAERVALNFLGHLSGIATLTHRYVERVAGLPVRISDTRKTTPGLRALERYAVRAGGGFNHRFGLSDAILIKDNHLAAAGSVTQAIARARSTYPGTIVEVECENMAQVEEAVAAQADAILLDNMDMTQLARAVALAHGKALLEASGGVTLANVREVALTGVDIISVGALTHSAPGADVALDFVVDG